MQTITKFQNAKSGQPDVAFYVIAREAEKTSWPAAIMAVICTWVGFLFGGSVAFSSAEGPAAYGASIALQNQQSIELPGGHARAPLSQLGVVGFQFFRVALGLLPYALLAGLAVLVVISLPSSYLLGRGIINALALFDFWSSMVGAETSPLLLLDLGVLLSFTSGYLLAVLLVIVALIGAVGFPLFRGAVTLFHPVSPN